jgi:hypothetical protein
MPKKAKDRSWRVYRLTGKKMIELGSVRARNEAEAMAKAIEEHRIPKPLQNRVLVRPEE